MCAYFARLQLCTGCQLKCVGRAITKLQLRQLPAGWPVLRTVGTPAQLRELELHCTHSKALPVPDDDAL
jgi:hypothetical protein